MVFVGLDQMALEIGTGKAGGPKNPGLPLFCFRVRSVDVVGVPTTGMAVTETSLPVEIKPVRYVTAGATGRVDPGIYLLVVPVHR